MLAFSDVVYRIYEATLSPQHWLTALGGIAELSDSDGSLILAHNKGGWSNVLNSPYLDGALAATAGTPWLTHNIWLDRLHEASYQIGDVYRDQDVATPEEIAEHPFYAHFLPSLGLGWNMGALIQSDFGTLTSLVVQRGKDKGPYSPAEMNSLKLISRHVEQSLRISSHFVNTQSSKNSLIQTLDAMDRATFILDKDQRPLHINRQALGLMGRYFNEENGCLIPTVREGREPFADAVRAVLGPDDALQVPPLPITLPGVDKNGMLALWIIPLVGASADQVDLPTEEPRVLVLAQSLSLEQIIDPTVVRGIFGLSLSEARLAALIGAGSTIRESAAQLGVTEGTARVVLKRVFQKMGVRRQVELVAKLSVFGKPAHSAGDDNA